LRQPDKIGVAGLGVADMRIAHLVSPVVHNGVATAVAALIEQQARAGHDVLVVARKTSWIAHKAFPATVTRLTSEFTVAPSALRATGSAIREWGADVLHGHGSRANKALMVFRIAAGAPAVMTAHHRSLQIPWRFADAVIAPSQPTAQFYLARHLVARRRMHVIPNLFDVTAFAPATAIARGIARDRLGLRRDALVFGTVGSIDDRKRQVDLLPVLRRLVAAGLDAELLLIGRARPATVAAWSHRLADPLIAGRVHLAGHRDDASALVPALDFFILASRQEEGPIAPLEAMAQAVPVVATDVGNMADLLPSDRIVAIGDIAAMADRAGLLLRDRALRAAAGAADRIRLAALLAPEIILPQIERVYRLAIDAARRRGAATRPRQSALR